MFESGVCVCLHTVLFEGLTNTVSAVEEVIMRCRISFTVSGDIVTLVPKGSQRVVLHGQRDDAGAEQCWFAAL